jgi:hypothetical protein
MAMGKRKRDRQPAMWVPTTDLPTAASHPFYRRLNQLLREHGFDDFAEAQCVSSIRISSPSSPVSKMRSPVTSAFPASALKAAHPMESSSRLLHWPFYLNTNVVGSVRCWFNTDCRSANDETLMRSSWLEILVTTVALDSDPQVRLTCDANSTCRTMHSR